MQAHCLKGRLGICCNHSTAHYGLLLTLYLGFFSFKVELGRNSLKMLAILLNHREHKSLKSEVFPRKLPFNFLKSKRNTITGMISPFSQRGSVVGRLGPFSLKGTPQDQGCTGL